MTDWIADYAIYAIWLFPVLILAAIVSAHVDRREQERRDLASVQVLRGLEAQWVPMFRHGVHEYQQHSDGRRRAVRIVANGDCPLLDEWLAGGAMAWL